MSAEESTGPLRRFIGSVWFRIIYLILVAFAISLVLVYIAFLGCLAPILVAAMMFGIPYWLKERKVRRYLLNGIVIAIPFLIFTSIIVTNLFFSYPFAEISGESGSITLSHGTVEPYSYGGNPATIFNFSVVYSSTDAVNSSDVQVWLQLSNWEGNPRAYRLNGNTSGSVSNGWVFSKTTVLPEGIYSFYFNATTYLKGNVSTIGSFGPINASWAVYFWFFLVALVVPWVIFTVAFYYIIVGVYWWLGKAKKMRPSMPTPQDLEMKTGPGAEFECTNCGADVPSDATRCPRCGAALEGEIEPDEERSRKTEEKNVVSDKSRTGKMVEKKKEK